MQDVLSEGLARYLDADQLSRLGSLTVGIAGCGGIGSNVAFMLARTGFRHFLLLDCDCVDASNLNRQQFFPSDVGLSKPEALKSRILCLSPSAEIAARNVRMSADNAEQLLSGADFWVEAFDAPEAKQLIVETCMLSGRRIFSASGMGGYGGPQMQKRELGLLTLVGDFVRDTEQYPPLAPRVTQAAAMLADAVVEWVLDSDRHS